MCGILIGFFPGNLKDINLDFNNSLNSLSHRGPDNEKSYIDDDIFLGHTRLSIIELSSSANQPFVFEDLVMVYNGEIFNYIEIRDELISEGYEFLTTSDTEVVIKAFHFYGSKCFSKFNGMWALAIYNFKLSTLHISRDRFGQKPLFFTRLESGFIFSSELQAISSLIKTQPNFFAISSFLMEGDFNVDGNTFFSEVFEFSESGYLTVDIKLNYKYEYYWEYPNLESSQNSNSTLFNDLLEDAVEIRMRSDVDYAILLSGGCDSTVIAGIMKNKERLNNLNAFTFSSSDINDESKYAKIVANLLNINLEIIENNVMPEEYITRLKKIVKHLGRGHSSPAIISLDLIYEKMKDQKFKIAIDGQGADELLAGYKHYHFPLLIDLVMEAKWKDIPLIFKDIFREGASNILIMALRQYSSNYIKKIMRKFYGYEKFINSNKPPSEINIFKPQRLNISKKNNLNKYLIIQHKIGLKNLLYAGDIVSMNHSIENRSPFMDHRLVDLSFSTDNRLKVDAGLDKAILRKHPVYLSFIEVLSRKKIGFSTPIPLNVKIKMANDLKSSTILSWPILNKAKLINFINGKDIFSDKYERFLFRLYQVHLWQLERE